MTPINEEQSLNLSIYRLVMRDTAAAKKAISYVGGDRLAHFIAHNGLKKKFSTE